MFGSLARIPISRLRRQARPAQRLRACVPRPGPVDCRYGPPTGAQRSIPVRPPAPFGLRRAGGPEDIYAVEGHQLTIGCPLAAGNVALTADSVARRAVRAVRHMPILGQPTPARGPTTTPAHRPPTRGTGRLCRRRLLRWLGGGILRRLAVIATGSDTGNSLRNPAQNVGVGSIKPSYWLVPKYGVTVSNTSSDTCGRGPLDGRRRRCLSRDHRRTRSARRAVGASPTFPDVPARAAAGDSPSAGSRIGSTVVETETSPARSPTGRPGSWPSCASACSSSPPSARRSCRSPRQPGRTSATLPYFSAATTRPVNGNGLGEQHLPERRERVDARATPTRSRRKKMPDLRRSTDAVPIHLHHRPADTATSAACRGYRARRPLRCAPGTASTPRRGRRSSPTMGLWSACGR